jgi:hypothetical protein
MELAIGKPPFLGANNTMMVRLSAPRPCTAHACQCHRLAVAQHGGRSVCVDRPVGKPGQTRPDRLRFATVSRDEGSTPAVLTRCSGGMGAQSTVRVVGLCWDQCAPVRYLCVCRCRGSGCIGCMCRTSRVRLAAAPRRIGCRRADRQGCAAFSANVRTVSAPVRS